MTTIKTGIVNNLDSAGLGWIGFVKKIIKYYCWDPIAFKSIMCQNIQTIEKELVLATVIYKGEFRF